MLLAGVALAACASELTAPTPMRLLVKLAQPSTDSAAITAQARAATGRAVRYVAATSERLHALSVDCSEPADCDAVLQRLRADTAFFETVQRDERKRIVTP